MIADLRLGSNRISMVQCYRPPGRDGVASVFALLVQPTPAMREDPNFLAHNSSAALPVIGFETVDDS